MKKDKYLWGDFDRLINLIKDKQPLTEEDKELWKQSLKEIEETIDKPTTGIDVQILNRGYELIKEKDNTFVEKKPTMMRRFKNWIIDLLKEKEA